MSTTTTIFVPFTPPQNVPFQFQATLDGNVYQVVTRWNLFGQRWYVYIYDLSGNLIVSLPLIGSPDTAAISHTAGYFSTTLVYRVSSNQFEISG